MEIAFAHDSFIGDANLPKHYTVSDGELVLFLWPAEEGGYSVTSPLDPALITEAETVEEAFVMAKDAWDLLNETRSEKTEPARSRTGRTKKTLETKRTRRSPV